MSKWGQSLRRRFGKRHGKSIKHAPPKNCVCPDCGFSTTSRFPFIC